jgi:hypothetical protein
LQNCHSRLDFADAGEIIRHSVQAAGAGKPTGI